MMNDYALSKERYEALRKIVVAGKDAKAVLFYAEKYEEIAKGMLLKASLEAPGKVAECAAYYRVVNDFCKILRGAVELGKQKNVTMQNMLADAQSKEDEQ